MLPDNTLIQSTSRILPPRNKKVGLSESFELGGADLSNTSEPFIYEWRGYFKDGVIYLKRHDSPAVPVLYIDGVLTDLSITFDQNMRPTIAYVEDGISKLYWYDASQAMMVVTEYTGIKNPKVSLDDKRKFNIANSDIIFAYVKNNNLCYRLQRERYSQEHLLSTGEDKDVSEPLTLIEIGMGNENRFLFITN